MAKSESKFVRTIKMMGAVSYKDYIQYLNKMNSDDVKQMKYTLSSQKSIWNKFVKGTIYTIIGTLLLAIIGTFYRFYQLILEKSSVLTPEEAIILIKGAFLVCIVLVIFLLLILLLITVKITGIETRLQIINDYLENGES
ncbi:hypothetical protein J5583_00380 [Streptococcus suis]|uniref:hypothetical protein n=1 Tax=Streptococcus suis TaxID=1307 RepID=UPI001ABE8768|nr:hypothetical protein [Streptococcus suis]MBO4108647.1 hypothetical protein [Streptococcus suis]